MKVVPQMPIVFFVVLLCVFSLSPLLWMVLTSFKLPPDIYHMPVKLLPTTFTGSNYITVVTDPDMERYFVNSLLIAAVTVTISMFLGLFAGYGLSRHNFPARRIILGYILYTTVFPRTVIILPLYILLARVHLQGTYQGLILTYMVVVLPVSIWLFVSFFKTVPAELEDAARIDGCNVLMMLWKVLFPLIKPGIFAVLMYCFVQVWNEYLFALVISSTKTAPVTLGLVSYVGQVGVDWGPIMAASCLMVIPTVVIFNAFGKYLVKGLMVGAVKG